MKKIALVCAVLSVFAMLLVSCGQQQAAAPAAAAASAVKVGMVTDAGTIDDKSFNQGTWTGIQKAVTDLKVDAKYLKPTGTTEADYTKEIGNLYDAGYKFIVTPGFKFSGAIFTSQDKYKDAKFVILDAAPAGADGKSVVGPNTVAIFFAEHEAGFIAGVAAALQLKTGEVGFIGGMEIPPVQKYNWGFQQGVAYANKTFSTKVVMKAEHVIYQGTFNDVAAGQQLAAQMFDKGVKAIFCAAGGVGVGAINEAKSRAKAGKPVWIVGVDVDQFTDGVYDDASGKSIILTSAMKRIDTAAYDQVKLENDGKFVGGQTLTYDSKNGGVGIPEKNPNLADDVATKVATVATDLQSGKIVVAAEKGSLIK